MTQLKKKFTWAKVLETKGLGAICLCARVTEKAREDLHGGKEMPQLSTNYPSQMAVVIALNQILIWQAHRQADVYARLYGDMDINHLNDTQTLHSRNSNITIFAFSKKDQFSVLFQR